MPLLIPAALNKDLESFFQEDDISRNFFYTSRLPSDLVECRLKFKDDLIVSGLTYFFQAFNYLGANIDMEQYLEIEGTKVTKDQNKEIIFDLPFSIALTGERIALNLLQRSSSIATFTNKFFLKAKPKNIKILDTRKTTPGLRSLEKYSVRIGGGHNHRLGQADVWMVKDNHKQFFGGVKQALDFFSSRQSFYIPLVLEVHTIEELKEAISLNVRHVMLDNFSPKNIMKSVEIKPEFMTYEVSGGIRLDTIDKYLIEGVDAISVGAITYDAPQVDISLKYGRK